MICASGSACVCACVRVLFARKNLPESLAPTLLFMFMFTSPKYTTYLLKAVVIMRPCNSCLYAWAYAGFHLMEFGGWGRKTLSKSNNFHSPTFQSGNSSKTTENVLDFRHKFIDFRKNRGHLDLRGNSPTMPPPPLVPMCLCVSWSWAFLVLIANVKCLTATANLITYCYHRAILRIRYDKWPTHTHTSTRSYRIGVSVCFFIWLPPYWECLNTFKLSVIDNHFMEHSIKQNYNNFGIYY